MIPLLTLLPFAEKLIDRFIPDPEQKAKALLDLQREENQKVLQEMSIALQADQGQMEINKIEAASSSFFVSGWRSFIGWTCGVAFAYHFILQPLMVFILSAFGYKPDLPAFDMEALNTVLMGMLGLGGLRSFEKVKGVAR